MRPPDRSRPGEAERERRARPRGVEAPGVPQLAMGKGADCGYFELSDGNGRLICEENEGCRGGR